MNIEDGKGNKPVETTHARVIATAELLYQIYRADGRRDGVLVIKEKFSLIDDKEARKSIDIMPLKPLRRRTTENLEGS